MPACQLFVEKSAPFHIAAARTVRQAAENVHNSAISARTLGDSVVTAGELLKETADFVDSMAMRAKIRTQQIDSRPHKKR
jgi:hypothetical protein